MTCFGLGMINLMQGAVIAHPLTTVLITIQWSFLPTIQTFNVIIIGQASCVDAVSKVTVYYCFFFSMHQQPSCWACSFCNDASSNGLLNCFLSAN